MTYEKFMEQIKEQIRSFLPEEYANADVTIQEVSKNNNCLLYTSPSPRDRG